MASANSGPDFLARLMRDYRQSQLAMGLWIAGLPQQLRVLFFPLVVWHGGFVVLFYTEKLQV